MESRAVREIGSVSQEHSQPPFRDGQPDPSM